MFPISVSSAVAAIFFAATAASIAYILAAMWNLYAFARRARPAAGIRPPVTILKPLCGLDFEAYENLRSFCRQDYPVQQIVFGVLDAADPAIAIVERLIAEFPERDIALVVDERTIGTNLKVSNLVNMARVAKYDTLVIADSDIRVAPDYLATVTAPLADPHVGVVTCLYKGTPAGGLPSMLAGMYFNEWFLPSVLVGAHVQGICFCFGATMAIRCETLRRVGGLKALSDYLADDYMLGKLVTQHGYKVYLSNYLVENFVQEKDMRSLFRHELRWARTIRAVEPVGNALSVTMYGIPMAILATMFNEATVGVAPFEYGLLALVVLLRLVLHYMVRAVLKPVGAWSPWLVPVRDILSFTVWAASFFGHGVTWRGNAFSVDTHGQLAAKRTDN
jgi:ceramide glucosyltransferase